MSRPQLCFVCRVIVVLKSEIFRTSPVFWSDNFCDIVLILLFAVVTCDVIIVPFGKVIYMTAQLR